MNRKQLFVLVILVVVIGGAGLLVQKRQNASYSSPSPNIGKKLLGEFPINDVARITIKQGTNTLNLAKKNDVWSVRERNDYPANYSEISEFLIKLADLKVVQTEQVGPSQLSRVGLATGESANSAASVELHDKQDKIIRTLLLGKKHTRKSDRPSPFGDTGEGGIPDGRYVKASNDSDSVALISDPLSNIDPKPEQWLDKNFFKVEKVRSIAVNFPEGTNSWKLSRDSETAEWKLADLKPAEQLDSAQAGGVANPLGSPSFTDVSLAKPEQLGLDKPTIATIDTFDGFTYTLKVGKKQDQDVPLTVAIAAQLAKERTPGKDEKPEDKEKLDKEFKENQKKLEEKLTQEKRFENWTYLVSNWTVDPLLKERSKLLVEKKEEPKDAKPLSQGSPPDPTALPQTSAQDLIKPPPGPTSVPPAPAPAPEPPKTDPK
jgi:hypothetical protein